MSMPSFYLNSFSAATDSFEARVHRQRVLSHKARKVESYFLPIRSRVTAGAVNLVDPKLFLFGRLDGAKRLMVGDDRTAKTKSPRTTGEKAMCG